MQPTMTDTPAAAVRHCACAACRGSVGFSCASASNPNAASAAPSQPDGLTLWLKRTDVGGADYSALRGLSSELTVDELKRRWVADKKLEVDPSLVSLRLVKAGEGEPTEAEEAAALLPAGLLGRPRLTLRETGVTRGSSLLACFAGAAGPPAGSLSARSALSLSTMLGRKVETNVMRRIYSRFSVRLALVLESGDKNIAEDLYRDAEHLPSLVTRENFSAEGVTLDGPLFEGSTLTVCFKGLQVLVAKCLDSKEYARAIALQSLAASSAAPRSAHVVDFELRVVHLKEFMLMPRMAATLSQMPHLAPEHALTLVQHLSDGLSYLHRLGVAHADVKPDNIGLQEPERFVLIDLGSVTAFGQRVHSTPAYVPRDVPVTNDAVVSCASLDWCMLGVTLGEKACSQQNCLDVAKTRFARDALFAHLQKHLPPLVWERYAATALSVIE